MTWRLYYVIFFCLFLASTCHSVIGEVNSSEKPTAVLKIWTETSGNLPEEQLAWNKNAIEAQEKLSGVITRRGALDSTPPPRIRGRHPPGTGKHPPTEGKHPPKIGKHPPGIGKHPPGVGRHPPDCGRNPPGTGHHPVSVGGHIWKRKCRPPSPPPPPTPVSPPSPIYQPDISGCCKGRGTGTFADVGSHPPCSGFCDCVNGNLVSNNTCYPGTLYNEDEDVQNCDVPSAVKCFNSTYNVPPPPSRNGLANGGILTTGYFSRPSFDCDPDDVETPCTILPLNYTTRNAFSRYSSSNPQEFVDWRNPGILTPVKLQQNCSSCWAFSVVSAVEAAIAINDRSPNPEEFSVQQILDCLAPYGDTCDGGDPNDVLQYLATKKSIAPASVYPLRSYKNVSAGMCEKTLVDGYTNSKNHSLVVGWERVRANDPAALMKVVSTQPAVIAISTLCFSFLAYSGGIFRDPSGDCGTAPDHNLVIVGYGVTLPTQDPPNVKYWLARNSWGTEWGEAGYIRILREDIGSGIGAMLAVPPVYPVLEQFTAVGHQNRRVNSALRTAFDPYYVRPSNVTYPPPPPSPPRPKGGRHPPGVGKRPPGIGSNPPGTGKRPPGVGDHPPVYGDHPPGIGDRIYPATACNGGLPFSTCGNGTCVPGADGITYSCICASGYKNVTNTDGNVVCALVDVCFSSTYNPCGVGECENDGVGGYSCTCPKGFSDYIRAADETLTCGPENGEGLSFANITWIVGTNDTCASIELANSLTRDQLLELNPSLNCSLPLRPNSTVAVGPITESDCSVIYTTTEDDTCNSVANLFTGNGYTLTTTAFDSLNSLSCADGSAKLKPHFPVCVAGGNMTIIQECGVYTTIGEGDKRTCKDLWGMLGALQFFSLNPGIDCNELLPGQEVCTSPLDFGKAACKNLRCPAKNSAVTKLKEAIYRVKAGDTCLTVAARKFSGSVGLISCYNRGFVCANSRLYRNLRLCYPKKK